MKKASLLFAVGTVLGLSYGKSQAQDHPFIVLEYMHVKQGNFGTYLKIENAWKHIHQAQRENGDILSWGVWQVIAPYNMNAPYQFVVSTIYAHFYNHLNPYKNVDIPKVFPGVSKDSLSRMFEETQKSRDVVKSDIFFARDHISDSKKINYIMAGYIKVPPEKEDSFSTFMKAHRRPVVSKFIKGGFADEWWYGGLMFGKEKDAPYNYIRCIAWATDSMYDKRPPFDQYRKNDPAAFQGYKFFTYDRTELLHRVVSLDDR
jgi:hypothetical protein